MTRTKLVIFAVSVVAIGAGMFFLGRASADAGAAHDRGYRAGVSAGRASGQSDGYADGLRVGTTQGVQEGRALQIGATVPADSKQPVQDAFNAGYTAGENDAFGGYDGGWALSMPYLITLEPGQGRIVYRISDRTTLQPGIDYYLCPAGKSICQQPHR
jgi:hypothetical protein